MPRLKLQAEALTVDSFATGGEGDPADTVQPDDWLATRPEVCDPFTLPPRCA